MMKKLFSSSHRPVWIGKTVTKQIASKKEYESNKSITLALKEVGMFDVCTFDDANLIITYDFIDGKDNQEIPRLGDAEGLIKSYNLNVSSTKLPTIQELMKNQTGYLWDEEDKKLLNGPCNYLTHLDLHTVNTIRDDKGKLRMIDWEYACKGPQYYDLGSWLMCKVVYREHTMDKIGKLAEKLIGHSPIKEFIYKATIVNCKFWITMKDARAKMGHKVYGRESMQVLADYCRIQLNKSK